MPLAAPTSAWQQHRGQNAAAARRGRGDDAFHAGVALGGFQRFGNDLRIVAAAVQRPGRRRGFHFGGVAARKAAGRTVAAAVVFAGFYHHAPQAAHGRAGFRFGQAAFGQIAAQDHFVQRAAFGLAGVKQRTHRGKRHRPLLMFFRCPG